MSPPADDEGTTAARQNQAGAALAPGLGTRRVRYAQGAEKSLAAHALVEMMRKAITAGDCGRRRPTSIKSSGCRCGSDRPLHRRSTLVPFPTGAALPGGAGLQSGDVQGKQATVETAAGVKQHSMQIVGSWTSTTTGF